MSSVNSKERKRKATPDFAEKFDETFGSTSENREMMLEFLQKSITDPALTISVTIVPGRPPIIASNIMNNDADQIEQMAQALDGLAGELRQKAFQILRERVNGVEKEPALKEA